MRCVVLLFVATLFLAGCCASHAATLKQYDSALAVIQQRLADDVQELDNGSGVIGALPGALAQRLLTPISYVRCPDGTVVHVDTAGLITAIKTADAIKSDSDCETAYGELEERIQYLRSNIHAETEHTEQPVKSRGLARAILSGNEFVSDPIPPPSWTERQEKSFEDWFNRVLNKLFGHRRNTNVNYFPSWWRYVLYTLAGLFLAAILALIVYLIMLVAGRRGARSVTKTLSTTEEAYVEARDTDGILTMADKHAKAGDYRAAFRLVYLATLVALDTGGVLRFDRSKTNWEYVRALRRGGRHDLYKALSPLTRDFDRVWYGQTHAGPDEYRRAVDEYQRLTASVGESTSASRA